MVCLTSRKVLVDSEPIVSVQPEATILVFPWQLHEGEQANQLDSAEVYELVGLFALAQLPKKYQNGSVRLYRDDGFGVLRDLS